MTPEAQRRSIERSAEALTAAVGAAPAAFAYPYGSCARETIACVRRAGVRCALTTERGRVREGDRPWHALQAAKLVAVHAGLYPLRAQPFVRAE
jgi:peptidoglycan/xylan/chitin deacetylase (PgdA/CDA1 family)